MIKLCKSGCRNTLKHKNTEDQAFIKDAMKPFSTWTHYRKIQDFNTIVVHDIYHTGHHYD